MRSWICALGSILAICGTRLSEGSIVASYNVVSSTQGPAIHGLWAPLQRYRADNEKFYFDITAELIQYDGDTPDVLDDDFATLIGTAVNSLNEVAQINLLFSDFVAGPANSGKDYYGSVSGDVDVFGDVMKIASFHGAHSLVLGPDTNAGHAGSAWLLGTWLSSGRAMRGHWELDFRIAPEYLPIATSVASPPPPKVHSNPEPATIVVWSLLIPAWFATVACRGRRSAA